MKLYILSILSLFLFASELSAQTNNGFKYQGVLRDASGNILDGQNVSLNFSIRQQTINGTIIYQQTINQTVNPIGAVTVVIGEGTATIGDFNTIDWSQGPYFLETAVDITGGTNFSTLGTTELLSVPYALHSNTASKVQNVTASERIAITTPTQGQLVFCTDCGANGELQVYNGTLWTNMVGGSIQTP